jgi:hypothetical protein
MEVNEEKRAKFMENAGKRKTATNSLAFNITYWNIYPIPCNRRSKNCYISVLCEKYNNGWSTYNF